MGTMMTMEEMATITLELITTITECNKIIKPSKYKTSNNAINVETKCPKRANNCYGGLL